MAIELPPFRLVSLAFYDRYEMKALYAVTMNGKHYWPEQYDLIPRSGVRTQWEPTGSFTSADVAKVIGSDCYRTTVELNGVPLGRLDLPDSYADRMFIGDSVYFARCPEGRKCLYVTISQTAWAATKPPWNIAIRVTKMTKHQLSVTDAPKIDEHGDVTPIPQYDYRALAASRARILPNPNSKGSYFIAKVYPTFQHARCQNCHALGSVAALVSRHSATPMFTSDHASRVRKQSSPTGPIISCDGGCHNVANVVDGEEFVETEWKAPAFERNIDWRQMNGMYTCTRVKTNLPTEDKASHHFYEDARIAWAVSSAMTPANTSLGRAPPGSFAAWREVLEPWLRGGMPCP